MRLQRFLDGLFWIIGKALVVLGVSATLFGMCAADSELGNPWIIPAIIFGGMLVAFVGYRIGETYV